MYNTISGFLYIAFIYIYIPCGGQVVAPFGHSQSSGAHEQDFISHLGQAEKEIE